jgi:hypothetical protein
MLALSIVLFVFAASLLVVYFGELGRPIDDTPIYPRVPDEEFPEVHFVPNAPVIRAVPGSVLTFSFFVMDWKNDIENVIVTRYDVEVNGALSNQTILTEDIDYLVFEPGSSGYERKVFLGCRGEMRIRWRMTARDITREIHVTARDSAGNIGTHVYKFRVEAVQHCPDFELEEPAEFLMDAPVIPVELVVFENETLIDGVSVYVDGFLQGDLVEGAGYYAGSIQTVNIPSGLHILEVRVTLRSGVAMSVYTSLSVYSPSLVPSVSPPLAAMFVIFGVILLFVRRESKPEEEKVLVGVRGKVYAVEKRKRKKRK